MRGAATRSDRDKGDTDMRCLDGTPQVAEVLDKAEPVNPTEIGKILLRTVRRLAGTPAVLVQPWYLDLLSLRADDLNAVVMRQWCSIRRITQGLIPQSQGDVY